MILLGRAAPKPELCGDRGGVPLTLRVRLGWLIVSIRAAYGAGAPRFKARAQRDLAVGELGHRIAHVGNAAEGISRIHVLMDVVAQKERGRILDELTSLAGLHRNDAWRLLLDAPGRGRVGERLIRRAAHIGEERLAIHRALQHQRCDQSVLSQAGDAGRDLPVPTISGARVVMQAGEATQIAFRGSVILGTSLIIFSKPFGRPS